MTWHLRAWNRPLSSERTGWQTLYPFWTFLPSTRCTGGKCSCCSSWKLASCWSTSDRWDNNSGIHVCRSPGQGSRPWREFPFWILWFWFSPCSLLAHPPSSSCCPPARSCAASSRNGFLPHQRKDGSRLHCHFAAARLDYRVYEIWFFCGKGTADDFEILSLLLHHLGLAIQD